MAAIGVVFVRHRGARTREVNGILPTPGGSAPTPVHYGQTDEVHAARQKTLDQAFHANPNRFFNKLPQPPTKPTATWINPPNQQLAIQA